MSHDERVAAWHAAIQDRAALAEETFAKGVPPSPEDTIAVALAHPESYELRVHLKEH